jgi:hypothetical protein
MQPWMADMERAADLGYTKNAERVLLWSACFQKCFPTYPTDEAAAFADQCVAEFDKRFCTMQATAPECERQKEG